MHKDLAHALTVAANAAGTSLAPAALLIARIEYPRLDVEAYLAKLDAMGELARQAVQRRLERTADTVETIRTQQESYKRAVQQQRLSKRRGDA